MKYEVKFTNQFKKDLKLAKKQNKNLDKRIYWRRKNKVLVLATATKDFIRCTPLEYSWYTGALWIFTEGGLKFKALKENKHIAAAVFETGASFGGLRSLQIEGTVELDNMKWPHICSNVDSPLYYVC